MSGPRIGELFAGYGGLGMGVQAVLGGEVAWYSDVCKFDKDGNASHYDPHRGPCRVWAHRHPDVPNIGDITQVDWSQVEPVDVLTGGSPCQDLSHAGARKGMTEGTRSNLWVAMREAIAQLRPSLVVWENVRGAYSAAADSAVEVGPGLLGPSSGGPSLRALGRVLGDLSDLGYVGGWHGLRAADVGAPHGRWRVFIVATPADSRYRAGHGEWSRPEPRPRGAVALLPSPRTSDTNGAGLHGDGGMDLRTAVTLLPTPRAGDGDKGGPNRRGSSGDLMLPSAVVQNLLPTPAVNDMGEGKTPDAWDEWTAKMQAAHGNGNGHGKSLAIEAQRLLPTPRAQHGETRNSQVYRRYYQGREVTNNLENAVAGMVPPEHGPVPVSGTEREPDGHADEVRPHEELQDLWGAANSEEVCERTPGGQERLSASEVLLPQLREHADGDHTLGAQLQSEGSPEVGVRGVRRDEPAARTSPRPQLAERRSDQLADPVCFMPSETALAGGPRGACGCGTSWGQYEAAIRRWEQVLGRCAPPPTELGPKGKPRLSAAFSEFLMGLPAGWITDVPGVTRNEALKLAGNGVVPRQAAAALRFLLGVMADQPQTSRPAVVDVPLLGTPTARDGKGSGQGERLAESARRGQVEGQILMLGGGA